MTVAADYLAQASLLRLLAVMLLVIAPHLTRLPLWMSGFAVAVILWRAVAALRQWRLPTRTVRSALALVAFAGVYLSFGRATGQMVGTAMLVVMVALKLTEMRERRDVMLVVFLFYFVMFTHFLHSQELWTVLYLLVCGIAITATLAEANHPGAALSPRLTGALAGRMMLGAIPVMLIMFVLFPRIPGPLWGLPSQSGASGTSGLSDSMEPGAISQLLQSDEVAFRVRFDGSPPPKSQLYWRGPSFWAFDGFRWTTGMRGNEFVTPEISFSGAPVDYEVTMESQRGPWMMALELPTTELLPPDSYVGPDYMLTTKKRQHERRVYRLRSYGSYVLQPELSPQVRQYGLHLRRGSNPRTLQYARELRASGLSDEQVIEHVLRMYREQDFFYTLEPPLLGRDSVDEFLFETRRGFCEHYASSFTALMRAAGIPARVTTGYQGGEINELGGYMVVRQSDAHAWSEVWLAGRGWIRVDPTAAVAPSRIEYGIESALEASGESLPGFFWSRAGVAVWLETRWDWVNATWDGLVLGYGPELQAEFLKRFGLLDWSQMVLALTVLLTVILASLGGFLLWQLRPRPHPDPVQRAWLQLCERLAQAGVPRAPHEGPRDYIRRAATQWPEQAVEMEALAGTYLALRYLGLEDTGAAREFSRAAPRLKLRS